MSLDDHRGRARLRWTSARNVASSEPVMASVSPKSPASPEPSTHVTIRRYCPSEGSRSASFDAAVSARPQIVSLGDEHAPLILGATGALGCGQHAARSKATAGSSNQ